MREYEFLRASAQLAGVWRLFFALQIGKAADIHVTMKERIDVPYTYIYDKKNNIFITDISYYDRTCVPEGGQLLQATAYMRQEEVGNKEIGEQRKQEIENLYDKHFQGWREQLVVPRISTRAVVQEIKWMMTQQAMPIFLPVYRNLFFAGDWCQGQGQLSELSFLAHWRRPN